MKIKDKNIQKIAKIAVPILKKNGVVKAGIFGSYARGEAKKRSDIDILVKTRKNMGLLEFAGIKVKLEEKLHKKVDLVEYGTIKPLVKKDILADEIRIL
mgnify:CR=1 FL=1